MGRINQKMEKRASQSVRDAPHDRTVAQARFTYPRVPGNELNSWRVAFVAGNRIQEYKKGKRLETKGDGLFDRVFSDGQEQITYPQKEERNYYKKGDILHNIEFDLRQFKLMFPKEFSTESDGFTELLFMVLDVKRTIKVGFLIEDIKTTDIVNFDGYVTLRRIMFVKDEQGNEIPYPIGTAETEILNRAKLSNRIQGDWALARNMTALKEVIELWMKVNLMLLELYAGGVTVAVRKQASIYIIKKIGKHVIKKTAYRKAAYVLAGFATDISKEFIKELANRFSSRDLRSQITQTTVNESNSQLYREALYAAIVRATTGKLTQATKEGWGKGFVQFVGPDKWKQQITGIADWLAREIASTTTAAFTETCVVVVKSMSDGRPVNDKQLLVALESLVSSEKWTERFVDVLKDRIGSLVESSH